MSNVDRSYAAMERHPCGCPKVPSVFPYACEAHASPRARLPDEQRGGVNAAWYIANTCPYCGRVNPFGLACANTMTCELCGLVTCASHDQGCFRLRIICPTRVNPRTKAGKELLRALAAIGASARE